MWIEIRDKISKTGERILSCTNGPIIEWNKALEKTGYSKEKFESAIERLLKKVYLKKVFISSAGRMLSCYRKVLPWEVIKTGDVSEMSKRETFRDVFKYMIRQKVYNVNGLACSIFDGGLIVLFSDDSIKVSNYGSGDAKRVIDYIDSIDGFLSLGEWKKGKV